MEGSIQIAVTPFGGQVVTFQVTVQGLEIQSAGTFSKPNQIFLAFGEDITISNPRPRAADFVVSGAASNPTVTDISGFGSTVLLLTLSTNILADDETITLSYTKTMGFITGVTEGELVSFTGYSVANTVTGVATTVSKAETNSAGNAITLTFNKDVIIEGSGGLASKFTVTADGVDVDVTDVVVNGKVLTLTLSPSVSTTGITDIRVNYDRNRGDGSISAQIRGKTGGLVSNFNNKPAPVTNTNVAPTGAVTISGTATQGETLTAVTSTIADTDGPASLIFSYQWQAGGNDISGATGETFVLTQAQVGATITVTVSYTDGGGNAETLTSAATNVVTATGLTPESAKQLNEEILPRLIHTMLGSTVSAVNSRMDDTFSGTPEVASYQFDGQTVQLDSQTGLSANLQNTVAQKLPNYIESLKDGTMDWKEMLSRSAFVMPLNGAGGAGSTAGATVWGGGDYNRMSGKFSDGDWEGDVLSAQLGIDQRLGKDMLAGGLVSWSKGDVDYNLTTQNGKETRGDYTHQITSVHPYFARSNDEVDLWGSVGYGQGKLAIKQQSPTEDSERSSDTRLLSLSAGGSGRLTQYGQSGLKLKSDIILAQVDIAASADKKIPADKLNSQRLRLLLEMGKERPLSSGGHFKPLLEVGLRYDGGVGESSGIGAVLNLGGHYANTTGLTVEGKLHTLLGQDEYQEWGIQGTIRQQANANGQGLSFSVNPSYGTVGISTNQVWQQELADDNNGTSNNSARLNVNMGYGLFTAGGLLTPYSEVSMSDSNHYRLGLRWKPSSPLSLHLYGERETSNNSDRILLEGRIRF